jgi:FkbM family methyltransferase
MTSTLKRIAARLPATTQHEMKRVYFRRQIRRGSFVTDEKEFALLDRLLRPGDWALDIGANVGHYTKRMSELVGRHGRVIAFEPVPDTFSLLAANMQLLIAGNVTLLNVAASDRAALVGMEIPRFEDGLVNPYQAHVVAAGAGLSIVTLPVDALALPARVTLAKIDVEGHELPALRGMRALIARDRPVMIVETGAEATLEFLHGEGYDTERIDGSSNVVCRPSSEGGAS